ncbi:Mis12 protein-domain-containing protein [Chytridium lagenaria]|nr:Mis12 protein-domain-containing protein [Chytridium lagenaria]
MLSAQTSATTRRRSRKFSLAAASSAHWNRPHSLLADDDPPPETSMDIDPPPGINNETAMATVRQEEQEHTMQKLTDETERERKRREADLVVEHFGFPPIEFIDDVINAVNDLMYQAMEEFQSFVDGEMEDTVEVEKGMAALETLLESAIDKNFDKFELYALQNIFSLPRNVGVVLPQYRDVDPEASEELDRELDEQIERLRKELIAEKYMTLKMNAAMKCLDHDLPCLEKNPERPQIWRRLTCR